MSRTEAVARTLALMTGASVSLSAAGAAHASTSSRRCENHRLGREVAEQTHHPAQVGAFQYSSGEFGVHILQEGQGGVLAGDLGGLPAQPVVEHGLADEQCRQPGNSIATSMSPG